MIKSIVAHYHRWPEGVSRPSKTICHATGENGNAAEGRERRQHCGPVSASLASWRGNSCARRSVFDPSRRRLPGPSEPPGRRAEGGVHGPLRQPPASGGPSAEKLSIATPTRTLRTGLAPCRASRLRLCGIRLRKHREVRTRHAAARARSDRARRRPPDGFAILDATRGLRGCFFL